MKATYSALMNSRFFNPAFNSAIFDGPVRIYFAQFHESMALKIYFSLQQKFPLEMAKAKELYRNIGQNVLVMIYPTTESFAMSFDNTQSFIQRDELSGDVVVGLNGPFEDELLPEVLQAIIDSLKSSLELAEVSLQPQLEA
jgi:hypothetical protein